MDIKSIHTRVLLQYLKESRKMGGYYSPTCGYSSFGYTTEQLKKELATREHVPNKSEARRIRQEKAKRR